MNCSGGCNCKPEPPDPSKSEDDKQGAQGILGEPFPNPLDDEPTSEESMADFQREGEEEAGTRRRPYKTIAFWASFVAMNLSFLAAAEFLPVQIQDWVIVALATLSHFGYGAYTTHFRANQDQLRTSTPTWKRGAFWASYAANLAAFGLGSGDPAAIEISAHVALILGYVGVNVRPHVRREGEIDPEENPQGFFTKLISLIVGLLTRKKTGE